MNRKRIGLLGGACSFAAIYAASSAPIPLYAVYRQIIGMSNTDLAMSSVLYFIGTVVALLFLARLSDYWGRRPVSVLTLLIAVLGCILFISVDSKIIFLIARLVQGLSCGMGSSCMASYIIDIAPPKMGAVVASSAPMIGLAGGSLGSGMLVQYGTGSLYSIYLLIILLLIGCMVLTGVGIETIIPRIGSLKSLKPTITIPGSIRPLLPTASAIFVGTWAIGGFYQAFSASMASECLGTDNVVIAAAVFACLQGSNIFGSMTAKKLSAQKAQSIGMSFFLVSVAAVITALGKGFVLLFLIASTSAGVSWGLAYTGSLQSLLSNTAINDRAGVLSAIYIISYSGAAIPNLIVGRLSNLFSLNQIAFGYGGLVMLSWVIVITTLRKRMNKEPDPQSGVVE